jgi:hypothetical protein
MRTQVAIIASIRPGSHSPTCCTFQHISDGNARSCELPDYGRTTSLPVALPASMSACAVAISSSV